MSAEEPLASYHDFMGLELTERVIAHIDLDAFFVSVELLRHPELVGQPVIVAGSGPRAVVTTASYEARRFGVGSAMPAARARQLCPQATVLTPDLGYYRECSQAVFRLINLISSSVERASLDEAYLDLSGQVNPIGSMRQLVSEIADQLHLDASVGVGPNKLVAKVCSDAEKPRGFVILSAAQAAERFAPESVRLLPGIGPKTTQRLAEMQIITIADLQQAAPEQLQQAFGPRLGMFIADRGWFRDDTPVAERERKSHSVESTFDRDIISREVLLARIRAMSAELARQLCKDGLSGKTISIKVRLADWTTITRSRTLDASTQSLSIIADTAEELLLAYGPPGPVRLLGVRMANFVTAA
jgi:DNA polymerase-4